jgi:autotransporter-associated beta strand protein
VQDGNPYTTVNNQITTTFSGNITPSGQTQTVAGAPSINTVDPTNHDFEAEWKRASGAWGLLDAANIPNYPIAGNHDYYHWDQKKDPSEFVKYFGPQRYQSKSWFGGYSPANTSTTTAVRSYAGMNTYSYFTAGGYKFLNLALQYNPDAGDLAWAQSVIDANKGLPTIVNTHDYQNTTGRDGAGDNVWNGLVNKAGNSQIFMVLSGHVNGVHQQTSTDADGKSVMEILSDYQDMAFNTSNGFNQNYQNGGGFLRAMDFDLNAKTIHVQTYSPYIDSQGGPAFLTTGAGSLANDFTLNFDFASRFGAPPLATGRMFLWDPGQTNSGTGGGGGTWDQSSTTWFSTSADAPWSTAGTNDTAVFGGTAGNVTVAATGVTVNDIIFKVPGYVIGGGTITAGGFQPTIDTTLGAATINSTIAGSAGLSVAGGTTTLGGANTFTGGLTVKQGGAVRFTADNNLGAAGQSVTLDGGAVTYVGNVGGGLTETRVFSIGVNGGTFDVPNAGLSPGNGKLVISGANKITGSGPITKTGQGWLTLYGSNSYSGNWTINGGIVEVGGAGVLGTGSITVNNGGELAANVTSALPNSIVANSGATLSADFFNQTNSGNFAGPVTVNGPVNVRLGNFYSNASQNLSISGKISGPGSLTITPALGMTTSSGKLSLSGDNSNFSGGITIPTGNVIAPASAGKPLGTGRITLSGGRLSLQGQLAPTGTAGAIAPVAATGFNKDTIYADSDTAKYPSGDSTTNTLMDGFFSYYQDGFAPGEGNLNQGVALTGGIASPNFNSAVANTVTGGNTPFALQPFTAQNTLQISQGGTGTLTLSSPTGFKNLSVLAVSSWAVNDKPVLRIHFTDGTTATTAYNAYDWSVNGDATKMASDAFAGGLNRYSPTQSPGWDQRPFGMYETDIDLSNIGGVDYSGKAVASLEFVAANSDAQNRGRTNIFAVSGAARSWGTAAAQTYQNDVTVSGDSSIDVSGSMNATMGALAIGGNKLSITSADTTTNSYGLTFGATTLNGAATFDVAASAGGGAGTVVLGPISGPGGLAKTGAGAVRLASGGSIGGAIGVSAGTVQLGGDTTARGVAVSGTGKIDITNRALIVDYDAAGPTPLTTIQSLILSGFAGGSWSGAGINSSSIAAGINGHTAAIGYAEASALVGSSGGTVAGHSVDGSTVVVRFTLAGDSNLDGTVDLTDFTYLASNFNRLSGAGWVDGDYNYDGKVDLTDFTYLAGNFNSTLPADVTNGLGANVPEPAMLVLLPILAAFGQRRRRRH